MIDIDAIKARLAAATPGPWTIDDGDDGDFCSAIAVIAPIPVSERQHAKFVGDFNERAVIALTLWQNPPVAVIYDARWDENASLIAHAPTDIAALIAEVEAIRSESLTMRQWAEEAAAAENANARELREARAEATCLRDMLNRMRDEMSNIAEDIYRDLWVVQFDDRGRAYEKRITDVLMRFSR